MIKLEPDTNLAGRLYALTVELTHRCPLKCLYCSNPLAEQLVSADRELSADQWMEVLEQASDLGVLMVHLSGGEPLVREDLEQIVEKASHLDLYCNLITSGMGLDGDRLERLIAAGLKNVQLSIQSSDSATAVLVAGVDCHSRKLEILSKLRDADDLHLTVNTVIHRLNIEKLESIVDIAITYGARKIELASCQYYGWALQNRAHLLPTREQIDAARIKVDELRKRLPEGVELVFVLPDYYEDYPKPCMGGWAARQMTITPGGVALPCAAAGSIAELTFPSVHEQSLSDIWFHSEAFNRFRGFDWLEEPCRSCDRKELDFGGCRCQAFALTGVAASTDPVCSMSPSRSIIDDALVRETDNLVSRAASYRGYQKHS